MSERRRSGRAAFLIDTWIASELVGAAARRATSQRTACTVDFYGTLSVIGVWGPLTPSEVADMTGTPLTTVSDRLRRMVAEGDVERIAHPDDGRSHLVRLTAAGDAHWRQGWPALQTDDRAGCRRTSSSPWRTSKPPSRT